jgi:hypothetical protein
MGFGPARNWDSLSIAFRVVVNLKFPALLTQPTFFGPMFGLAVVSFMHYLVVPLSASPTQPPARVSDLFNLLLSHTLFVGLPIALITSRAVRVR